MSDDALVKQALMKSGDARSYDDILVLKSRLSKIQFFMQLFSNFMPNQINDICKHVTLEVADRDSYVFKQGDFGSSFFVILEGKCEVRVRSEKRDPETGTFPEKSVHTLLVGSHFGERALEHDEPRSAGILATERTTMISMTRKAYKKAMKARAENEAQISLKEGTKAYTLRVLGKRREDRSMYELRNVAYYLDKRVAYFKKFDEKTQIELARCCELISIYGRNILFKQGQIGQAFYILMSGTCDVIVSTPETDAQGSEGIVVNTLGSGAAFGERALESDEGRSATIVTGDDLTELLVISKDDYHLLIAELVAREKQEKFDLLRKTHAFGELDDEALSVMSTFMEPKQFLVDTTIFNQGDKAADMLFILSGEVQLQLEVVEQEGGGEMHVKHSVDLGRLGPGTVLGQYMCLPESFLEECTYLETCETSTYVQAFAIAKYDLFFRIPTEILERIRRSVRYVRPPKTSLFQNTIKQIDDAEFRRNHSWKVFRSEYVGKGKKVSILESLRAAKAMELSGSVGNYRDLPDSPREIAARKIKDLPDAKDPLGGEGDGGGNRRGRGDAKKPRKRQPPAEFTGITETHMRDKIVHRILQPKVETQSGPGAPVQPSGYVMGDGSFKYPFALVHLHREQSTVEDIATSRRHLKTFVRYCGTASSVRLCKEVVAAFLAHAFIHIYQGALDKEYELQGSWSVYKEIDSIPVHHTDIFVIFCRSAIIEYMAFTPKSANFFEHDFPMACREERQRFAVVSTNPVTVPRSSAPMDRPLYLTELAVTSQVQAVFDSSYECANYAKSKAKAPPAEGRILLVPMYRWLLVAEEAFDKYDVKHVTVAKGKDLKVDPLAYTHAKKDQRSAAEQLDAEAETRRAQEAANLGRLTSDMSLSGLSRESAAAEAKLTLGHGLDIVRANEKKVRQSLSEFGVSMSKTTEAAISGEGIIAGDKVLSSLDKKSLNQSLKQVVNKYAHSNSDKYRHRHGDATRDGLSSNGSASIDDSAATRAKLQEDDDFTKARIRALSDTVKLRSKALQRNDELLSIEAFVAQKRNERHDAAELAARMGMRVEEMPALPTSEVDEREVDKEALLGTSKGAIDMSLIPKQLSYSIRVASERGNEIVAEALSKRRVELFTELTELPSLQDLSEQYRGKVKRDRDRLQRETAVSKWKDEQMKKEALKSHAHAHHIRAPSTPPHLRADTGVGGAFNPSDMSTVSPGSVDSQQSVSTEGGGPTENGQPLYLSYTSPNADPHHAKKKIHQFKLATQLKALGDLIEEKEKM